MKEYIALKEIADKLAENGMNGCDPVLRSVINKMAKLYKRMSKEEQRRADMMFEEQLPF